MKITFVAPLTQSGGGRVVALYSRLLAARGHAVCIVHIPTGRRRSLLRFLSRSVLARERWNVSTQDGVEHRVLDFERPVVDADVPDGDIVIATWWETSEWVAALGLRKGRKVYFVQGHEIYDWLPQARTRASYRLPLHKIVVSKWLDDIMRTEYDDASADVVPNGVDHSVFFAAPRGKQVQPTVGLLYNPTPLKGIDVALGAIELARARIPTLQVRMFGLESPARTLPPYVQFTRDPPQPTLRDIYATCDVWLSASRSEGFNLPAMEAMACRTPVVATRTGWPAHAIVDGVNGFCVAIDDTGEMARRIAELLHLEDAAWRRLSANAAESVRDYSWLASVELFERALERVRNSLGTPRVPG